MKTTPLLYSVVVGNIGTVYSGNGTEATRIFANYKKQSQSAYGRASGESVYIFLGGEIVREFHGKNESTQQK